MECLFVCGCVFVCVCARVGESSLYTCCSEDLSIQNPRGTFSTPKVLHRACKIHFPFKEEGAVWPVRVNTAVCARIKEAERRESVHVIGLCRERRWTGVRGRAGHRGERALSCPLQPFKDNKPQPPRRVDINSLYSYMCTCPVSRIRNAEPLLSRMKHALRSEEANDNLKDSFFKKHFAALHYSLFAHVRAGCWH